MNRLAAICAAAAIALILFTPAGAEAAFAVLRLSPPVVRPAALSAASPALFRRGDAARIENAGLRPFRRLARPSARMIPRPLPLLRSSLPSRVRRTAPPRRRNDVTPAAVRVAFPYNNRYNRPRRPVFRPRRSLPPVFRPPRKRPGAPRPGPAPAPAPARRISPSEALRNVLRITPGSMGLGVELLPGGHPVYAVKVKTGSRIRRVLVDALSGRVLDR